MQKILIWLGKVLKNLSEATGIVPSARLKKELELSRQAERELFKRNHFLQHILDASTTRIWHFDKEVRVVSLNKAAQENLEFPLAHYLGKTTFDYFYNLEDARLYYEMDMQVINSGQADLGRLDIYEAPDGNTFYKKVDRIPYFDENGAIAGLTVYSYDITEQKRAEISLLEQRLELEAEIKKRITAEKELRRLARTDPLTGIYNRRHFFELGNKELTRTRRTNQPLSILMFDIDHFKRINDTYGHQVGDRVLKTITATCHENLRQMDVFARYGGEEFVILLPEIGVDNARQVAHKMSTLIGQQEIMFENQRIAVTASLGVAALSSESESLDQLLARADDALYQAKEAGRNRVMIG